MIPSSSSQLARYGQVHHYKKFWLLQTQLEKQEQSASSSLSLGNTNMSTGVANIAASPLVALSGDHHHVANSIAASPYIGTCRADMAASATNCSGRVNSGSTFSNYCPNEPARASTSYLMHMPGYRADVLRGHGPSQLSLAVNCDNVSDSHEYESSESSEVEKRVCNRTAFQVSSTSSIQLRVSDQLHGITDFQSRNNIVHLSHSNSPLSAPLSSNGNLRTCSLCGTTKTPLWRSGPDGPKSLCNACGIRVKKTKKLEAALQATSGSSPSPSPSAMNAYKGALKRKLTSESGRKDRTFHKKKRLTSSMHVGPMMAKQGLAYHEIWDNGSPKLLESLTAESGGIRGCANICAKDVEEAAVLLMALSCGLVLS